jgi:probable rRNA maturation factor
MTFDLSLISAYFNMVEINNTTRQKINLKQTVALVEEFLRVYKKSDQTVSVALVGAKKMRRLNFQCRGIDRSTDVLSFSPRPNWPGRDKAKNFGEVVLNLAEVKKTGRYRKLFGAAPPADYVFKFILVHGLLHLAGYDDRGEAGRQEMFARGKRFLDRYYL